MPTRGSRRVPPATPPACRPWPTTAGSSCAAWTAQPGIHSARWAGPERDFDLAIAKVLDGLAARFGSFAAADRAAAFVAVLCLALPDGAERYFEGRSEGQLVDAPRGARGFGYDPIFVPEGATRTFAEMTAAEKHAISHRRRALDAFLAALAVP